MGSSKNTLISTPSKWNLARSQNINYDRIFATRLMKEQKENNMKNKEMGTSKNVLNALLKKKGRIHKLVAFGVMIAVVMLSCVSLVMLCQEV
jgi:hypothetical protein